MRSFPLRDARGRLVSLHDVRGRPTLIAFASRLDLEARRDQFRGELRSLGAALIVITRETIALLAPDDDVETLELVGDGGTDALFAHFGVKPGADGAHPLGLFVVDGDEAVVWQQIATSAGTDDTEELLAALRRAATLRQEASSAAQPLFNRREMIVTSLAGVLSVVFLERLGWARSPAPPAPTGATTSITLQVNGVTHKLDVEPRVTLLDALREQLGLTGTKKGCDHGQCGACTVLVGGRRIDSCLTLAIMHQTQPITTIEGLANGNGLHRMQAAFVAHDAFQCGYCTPGQIMSAVAMLEEGRVRSESDVREQMSGNLCRCAAYPNIVAAITSVMGKG
ncbi:MAG: (2Fe-2S)-binding protein [Myxococcales bacterium]|nr:(2Fe-2S)-binding protein [Myxococcales bacterium]